MSTNELTEAMTQAMNQAERVFDDEIGGESAVDDLIEGVRAAETADTASKWGSAGALAGVVGASALRRRMNRSKGGGLDVGGSGGGQRGDAGVVRDLMNETGSEVGGTDGDSEGSDTRDGGDADSDSGSGALSAMKRIVVVLAAVGGLAVALRRLRSSDETPLRASDEDGRGDLGLGSPDAGSETGATERETPETNTDNETGNPGRGDFDDDERATTSADAEVELGSDEETGQHVHRGSTTDEETSKGGGDESDGGTDAGGDAAADTDEGDDAMDVGAGVDEDAETVEEANDDDSDES